MNKRDTKFISRIIVLAMIALALGFGVRIFLENDELAKLVPRTNAREFLVVFAPLVSLMAIHYTLAVKSFGIRSLQTEGMVFAFCASLFLAITLVYFFTQSQEVPAENCPWWRIRGCESTLIIRSNYIWSSAIFAAGLVALFLALRRERLLGNR